MTPEGHWRRAPRYQWLRDFAKDAIAVVLLSALVFGALAALHLVIQWVQEMG